MKEPLLHASIAKRSKFRTCLFAALCTAILLFCAQSITPNSLQTNETSVGVNLEWRSLLHIFWAVGHYPKFMRHSMPYSGVESPLLPISRCQSDYIRNCHHICLDRMRNPGLEPPLREIPEPAECLESSVLQSQVQHSCWDTTKMRCWDSLRGRNTIWDGVREWTLLRHWQGGIELRSEVSINWMHVRSLEEKMDLIVFSWGVVRAIPDICDLFEIMSGLPQRIQKIPASQAVAIMGHSEGSGWAVCTNKYMHEQKLPHVRRVVASAALLATRELVHGMDPESQENSRFLLLGMQTNLHGAGMALIPDVFTIIPPARGATFPQFGYACKLEARTHIFTCLEPQPQLDIGDGLQRASSMQGMMAGFVIRDIHPFSTYKLCYRACLQHFEQTGFDFTPNVPVFIKEPAAESSSGPSTNPSAVQALSASLQFKSPATASSIAGSGSEASSSSERGVTPTKLFRSQDPSPPIVRQPRESSGAGPSTGHMTSSTIDPDIREIRKSRT